MSSITTPAVPLAGTISAMGRMSGSVSAELAPYQKYDGSYEVFPRKVDQTLNTSDKLLTDDIKVDAIRYSEVSNPEGGVTINIGYE